MSVDDDGIESERLQTGPVSVHVVLEWSRVRLAQPVDVDDGAQVVQLQLHEFYCTCF